MTRIGMVTTDTIPGHACTMEFKSAAICASGGGQDLAEALSIATNHLREEAAKYGANFVVGVSFSHSYVNSRFFQVSVIASGTAVVVDPLPADLSE